MAQWVKLSHIRLMTISSNPENSYKLGIVSRACSLRDGAMEGRVEKLLRRRAELAWIHRTEQDALAQTGRGKNL